jgi:hypothetical protein
MDCSSSLDEHTTVRSPVIEWDHILSMDPTSVAFPFHPIAFPFHPILVAVDVINPQMASKRNRCYDSIACFELGVVFNDDDRVSDLLGEDE